MTTTGTQTRTILPGKITPEVIIPVSDPMKGSELRMVTAWNLRMYTKMKTAILTSIITTRTTMTSTTPVALDSSAPALDLSTMILSSTAAGTMIHSDLMATAGMTHGSTAVSLST
jgi:hypothetical protein